MRTQVKGILFHISKKDFKMMKPFMRKFVVFIKHKLKT